MNSDQSRIASGTATVEDTRVEASVRPRTFDEFIGQTRVKENLQITVEAAIKRGEPLDHVLLYGPPGLGKTTLAAILAKQMGSVIKVTSGPMLDKKLDLVAVLMTLRPKEFFFIDEIHRMNGTLEEVLYPAMEDFRLDMVIGQKTHALPLSPFTLIAATTRPGMISSPLRARFGIVHRLDSYTTEDMLRIVLRSARILGIAIDEPAANEIARRGRGTPRVANRLLRRVRDYAQVRGDGSITLGITQDALKMLGVDALGLDDTDRQLLLALIRNGGRLGLNTLAAAINEDEGAVVELYEPYLAQLGLIDHTPGGRVATALAYKHLGMAQARRQVA